MGVEYLGHESLPEYPLWQKASQKRVPLSFDLELTARCNNDCTHCYINLPAGDAAARDKELSLAEIDDLARQAVALGALWCLITGGEPLLRPDFADVYMLLKRKGLLVSVFTNACLVTEEQVALFQRYPPRDIEVSVYGVTEATYERVTRKPGSYAAFRRGLDRLLAGGIPVRLKAMALRSTVEEFDQIARFCREHTHDYFRFDPLLHLRYDGDPRRNAAIRAERLSAEEVVRLEAQDPQRAQSMLDHCDSLIQPVSAHSGCDHLFHCGAGNDAFTIGYDATFRLCSGLVAPETTADLRQISVADAWNNLVPRVRDLRATDERFLSTCGVCPLVNLCLWCPAHGYLESGRMDWWNESLCAVAHARQKALIDRSVQE
jgi:radical SAM protein with 4Fe4S-binding SPASM domain